MKKTLKDRIEQLQILTASSVCLYGYLRPAIVGHQKRELQARLKLMRRETLQLRKEVLGY